jgi:hypothetical protein
MSLTLTAAATEKLHAELERRRKKPGVAFRLLANPGGGFGMRLDEPGSSDVVLQHQGKPLLVMEPALAKRLSDAALDIGRGNDEPEWVLVRGSAS